MAKLLIFGILFTGSALIAMLLACVFMAIHNRRVMEERYKDIDKEDYLS